MNIYIAGLTAIGASMFNIQALELNLKIGFSPEIAALMGILTGISGGIMRDMLTYENLR